MRTVNIALIPPKVYDLTFKPDSASLGDDTFLVRNEYRVTTADDGTASISLPVPAIGGSLRYEYCIENTDVSGVFYLGAGAAINFEDLAVLGVQATPSITDYITAILAVFTLPWGRLTGSISNQSDLQSAFILKANLASPTFTGVPAAPTATPGTNTTQLATTAFVAALGATLQPLDGDLTAIGGLTPANDDIIQRKGGVWVNRTPAQYIADLAALGTTFQPLDSDLTAIAALTTTSFGRGLLALTDAAALTALLNNFTSTLKGLVPLSGGGTTNFLRADGTWAAPGGGGLTIGNAVSGGGANRVLFEDGSQNLAASANLTSTSTLALQAITPSGGEGLVVRPTTDFETLLKLKNVAGSTGLNILLDGNVSPYYQASQTHRFGDASNTYLKVSNNVESTTSPAVQCMQVVSGKPALGLTGHMQLSEQTAPSAPAANNVFLYAVDNGAGKTQLMALFSSGAAQQIAIQP